jgi:hypothetical protein
METVTSFPQSERSRQTTHRLLQLLHQRRNQKNRQSKRKSNLRFRPKLLPQVPFAITPTYKQIQQHSNRKTQYRRRFSSNRSHTSPMPIKRLDLLCSHSS